MRMISACEDQITQTTACVELPIENYHIVAACHAFLPFHAYEQYKNGPFAELDFTKRIVYRGLFNLYSLVRQPIPKHIIDGWIFEPLLSTTGYAYNFINLQKESLIGIIGYNESKKIISISFRGTQCLSDWCNNMTFSQLPIKYTEPAVLLHGGYVSIFKHLKKDLYRKLLAIGYRLSPKEKKELTIILTGHSLGGAVASVTVPFIKKYFPTTHIKLVTFGAPKVGKQDYNNWLDENEIKVTSFVRKTDPAPYAPASLRNCMLGTVIWLHHFYHFLWPLVHDMRYYLKAMLNIYNQYRDIEDHVTYYDFYHVLLPGGIKL
jgi:hypothetical protein